MTEANIFQPRFDDQQERNGFAWRRAMLGRQAGAPRLGLSLYELEVGEATFPLHYHLANEEMLIVLAGTPTLRTGAGERELAPGEVVAFARGRDGAHQIVNRGASPARILIASEMNGPDVVIYPDSGKVGVREHPPGSAEGGIRQAFFADDQVDYWDGESPPEEVR
jgi:uncharacterized cupin superfamily protein